MNRDDFDTSHETGDDERPRRRKIPIPNPALTRLLDELDKRRAALAESTASFRTVNDRLEARARVRAW